MIVPKKSVLDRSLEFARVDFAPVQRRFDEGQVMHDPECSVVSLVETRLALGDIHSVKVRTALRGADSSRHCPRCHRTDHGEMKALRPDR
jgi:hypothetical protein